MSENVRELVNIDIKFWSVGDETIHLPIPELPWIKFTLRRVNDPLSMRNSGSSWRRVFKTRVAKFISLLSLEVLSNERDDWIESSRISVRISLPKFSSSSL